MTGRERLWRVRREHAWIDAQISPTGRSGGARVDFFYDRTCIFSREFQSRELAIGDAEERLHHLQRVGWNTHW